MVTLYKVFDGTLWAEHARIQEFSSGGGGGGPSQSDQKSSDNICLYFFRFFFCFVFLSPKLILQKSNGQFQRYLSFFKVPEGVQHFPGGVQLFPGWSNCLFPIETYITCDFPGGGSGPPVPPSGSALTECIVERTCQKCSPSSSKHMLIH